MSLNPPVPRPADVAAIVQFWDSDAPEEVQGLLDSVRDANPSMPYRFFDDGSAREFVRVECGSEAAAMYDNAALPAMRADLFRYCWLALHGGFYVDADYGSLQPLEPLIAEGNAGLLYERPKGICNSAIYARDPNDPLMVAVLERALHNVRTRRSQSVWDMTGPAVFQRLYAADATRALFDGYRLVREDEFRTYFHLADSLPYKSTEAHWFVAKHAGISPFRDERDPADGDAANDASADA